MSVYENRVELKGFLGKDPESKTTTQSARKLAILSLATRTSWTDAGEQRHEKTEWHRVVCWNDLATADQLKKGDNVHVVGTLVSNAARETSIVRFLFPRSATLGQCDELPAVVTVLWCPALHHPPLEVICQHWRIALVETRQFFHIRDREHGFTSLTLFRHISPLSR
jgi:hypothetical protein